MSRPSRVIREDLDKQAPAPARRSASTYQASSRGNPPRPSEIDEEEVDLENGEGSLNDEEDEERTPLRKGKKSKGAQETNSRFGSFWSGTKNESPPEAPPQPIMDDVSTFRSNSNTAQVDINRLVDQHNAGPTETEFTLAKILCLPGCACCSGGGGVFAFACYLSSLGLKDIAKEIVCCSASLLCCTKAISAATCACGTCLVVAGVATALASKRR